MTKSEDIVKSSDKRLRSTSRSTIQVPLHFAVHKAGCHFESCCGVCNLFPGVLLIAFCQVLFGAVLLTLLLTRGQQYDMMHQTESNQWMSTVTGAVLTGVTGGGLLLIVVALTENCRAMLVYLMVAFLVLMGITTLALTKIGRSCVRFKDGFRVKCASIFGLILNCFKPGELKAKRPSNNKKGAFPEDTGFSYSQTEHAHKIKDECHRLANLACVTGLFTFFGAVLYLYSFVVVFSFYHYRYVRRAILLHEAECE